MQLLQFTLFIAGNLICTTGLFGQGLSDDQIKYLDKEAININVNSAYAEGNWSSVMEKIGDKKIVLLGELNHGSKEIFASRTDLIKALHEELGYAVILFESGIGEMAVMGLEKEKRKPAQLLYGFFNGWRTKEHEELLAYVKEKNISIAGFDVQRTGGAFKYLLTDVVEDYKIDFRDHDKLEERYGVLKKSLSNRKVKLDSIQSSTLDLIKRYSELNELLTSSTLEKDNKKINLVKRTLINRIRYLGYMLQFKRDNDWSKRWAARDLAMSNNIKWLIENFFPNEKIIVVAHNFHIAKFNQNEQVMGEFLKEHFASEMYALGVFAGEGSYYGNYGTVEELMQADSTALDIKHVIHELDSPIHFLHIPSNPNVENGWLFSPITINDTFIDLSNSNALTLSKCFDGLLFIDKISPPEK